MSIEVITGPMFSGKTTLLLKRLQTAKNQGLRTVLLKPKMDTRYSNTYVVTHDNISEKCKTIESLCDILKYVHEVDVIGIDEVQFFSDSLLLFADEISDRGIRLIFAGLDMDYLKFPFGCMPQLMAKADDVIKLHGLCTICGKPAMYSKRISGSKQSILIGTDEYESRCRDCWEV